LIRAVLCTSGGRPGAAVLKTLRASGRIQVVGLVISTRILSPRYGPLRGAWEQYRRSGWRYTAYLAAASFAPMPVANLPRMYTREINSDATCTFIAQLKPDVIVSAFFNQRIHEVITALAPSALNIHPSLLPAFKGVDPVFYALLRDAPLGVTVHRIAPDLDSGDIIAQRRLEHIPGASVLSETVVLYTEGASLLVESLGMPAGLQVGSGNYDSWPTRAEVAALRRKGIRLARLRDLLVRAP
jgi:methionyl-tRNA formyltransferase